MDKNKPNIVLIMSDQHRSDCLGSYGNQDVDTHHIDQLAEDGVLFENSFCASPVCTPSRYSLLTSMYPHQHQGYTNESTIPSGIETFPRLLKNNGYQTKVVGKMHVTPTYLDVGFHEMMLAEQTEPGRDQDDYHRFLKENDLIDEVDLMDQVEEYRNQAPKHYWETFGALESNLPEEYYSTSWIGEQALRSIEQWQDDQNLLMVSFIKPHHPFDPPFPWSEMYNPDDLSLLPGWTQECLEDDLKVHQGYFPHEDLTEIKLKNVMAKYYGTISHIDHYVGKITQLLKEKGVYDNTLIIYTSDHGEYMGYHHLLLKSNHMYDPLMKVPLIIKYPNQYNKGSKSSMLVNNIDIGSTILDVAQCQNGKYMSGKSLLNDSINRDFVFSEDGRGKEYMVRSEEFKLLLRKDQENSMFFDLEKDPLELNNLYDYPEYQEQINEYKDILSQFILFDSPSPVHLDENAARLKDNTNTELREWVNNKASFLKS
ncbi:sulfatase family protein [Oceanobacillus salinisoli]|uniref:sulfatase family protein n=1 Tax=Oceanobacillus salinisoli TaxID=2678611 RepID=UPI0012E2633D|nr:sulfatase-like hydrolase/transferase [Oceanobacillus salinisoli]